MLTENEHATLSPNMGGYSRKSVVDPVLHDQLKNRVIEEQGRGRTLESMARVVGVSPNTLIQWLSNPDDLPIYGGILSGYPRIGTISGNLNNFFMELDSKGIDFKTTRPARVETSITSAIADGIMGARSMCIPRLIDAPPGVGKTEGINQYLSTILKAEGHKCPVLKIRLNGVSLTLKAVLSLIAGQAFGINGYDDKNDFTAEQAIEKTMEGRGGVLIVDEAQHLGDADTRNAIAIIDLLRGFTDSGIFGVVMFSNSEIYKHLSKGARRTQILSRMEAFRIEIFGLGKGHPGQIALLEEDVLAVMKSWGAKGAEVEEWCLRVARQPGALRNVTTGFLRALEETDEISIGGLKRYVKL